MNGDLVSTLPLGSWLPGFGGVGILENLGRALGTALLQSFNNGVSTEFLKTPSDRYVLYTT